MDVAGGSLGPENNQMSRLEASGRVLTNQAGGPLTLRRYKWYVFPTVCAADGSRGVPGYPSMGTGQIDAIPRYASAAALLARADSTGPHLRTADLDYTGEEFPRTDVSLEDALDVADPTPDLRRLQLMAISSTSPSVLNAWQAYMTHESVYQIPSEIPSDRTFAFSSAEVEYVDRAARLLLGTVDGASFEFPLL